MTSSARRANRLIGTALILVIALVVGACSAGESDAVDAVETRESPASSAIRGAADPAGTGAGVQHGETAGTGAAPASGTARSGTAGGPRAASGSSTSLVDPPDTMPGRTYDPSHVALARDDCTNRRATAEFYKSYQKATFSEFADWFPLRPLAGSTSLPAGRHKEVVYVRAGDEGLRFRQGDPDGSFAAHVMWIGRPPDQAPLKELLEAGGAMVMYLSTPSPYARRDLQEPVVVRGQSGGISRRSTWGCVVVEHWDVDWAAPASRGGYVYMRVFLSAKQFTREQALQLCEAMEDWPH